MFPLEDDPLWYKDAIIYELHVKGFYDSNGDGIGDFAGLTEKLDYIKELGITCIWLLPFYPSPLRDDGYDIADYRMIQPRYGTMHDFRQFMRAAHERGLRVMTELVINHTSDQHPWFQAARRGLPGSAKRNYYVWSESAAEYKDARIIFTDTEKSNWAWDDVAKAHYWHRFFSHQPDLNFDNPVVLREVVKVMDFWLQMGVDGFRLDAIPYLIERDGTNCENLAETHRVIKSLRHALESRHPGRVFLAEANQWPEDVVEYFGQNDECHMAYHFPLMPRMFMGLRREDSYPIIDILQRTPEIPEACQWALFLRNHDELTLEMVSDEERDYMYSEYARDPRMKCNVGIRRRLAPLMDYSRATIELLYMMLFSLPGTPIIYYGDEIGMGDNIYLGDRDGVRTPMQWNGDRNGGFSRADTARLYLPPIVDPVCGYQAVNVEAQQRTPASLLNWLKLILAHRQRYKAFGRGSIEFVPTGNRKVLAYIRRYQDEVILVVVNLSRFVQAVELDLSGYRGLHPVEIIGQATLPMVTDAPYFMTMAPHGYYWFALEVGAPFEVEAPSGEPRPVTIEEMVPIETAEPLASPFSRDVLRAIQRRAITPYLRRQSWFAPRGRQVKQVRVVDWVRLDDEAPASFALVCRVRYTEGDPESVFLPVVMTPMSSAAALLGSSPDPVLARITAPDGEGVLFDATLSPEFCSRLFRHLDGADRYRGQEGVVAFRHGRLYAGFQRELAPLDQLAPGFRVQQGFSSRVHGEKLVFKICHVMREEPASEVEMLEYLTEVAKFPHVPEIAGTLEYQRRDGSRSLMGLCLRRVAHQGTAWEWTLDELHRLYEDFRSGLSSLPTDTTVTLAERVRDLAGIYPEKVRMMGALIARMHRALVDRRRGQLAFVSEPLTAADGRDWVERYLTIATGALATIEERLAMFPPADAERARELLDRRAVIESSAREFRRLVYRGVKTRVHRNLHLDQFLRTESDFVIVNFKSEIWHAKGNDRLKDSPLIDVASMLRSFRRAAWQASTRMEHLQVEGKREVEEASRTWLSMVRIEFLEGYFIEAGELPSLPARHETRDGLLRLFELQRTLEELWTEARFRPASVGAALRAVLELLSGSEARGGGS